MDAVAEQLGPKHLTDVKHLPDVAHLYVKVDL